MIDEDDIDWYEERAAIREHLGGFSKEKAEQYAMAELRVMVFYREEAQREQAKRERYGIPAPPVQVRVLR